MKMSVFICIVLILALSLHYNTYKSIDYKDKPDNKRNIKDITIEKRLEELRDKLNELLKQQINPHYLPNPIPEDSKPEFIPTNILNKLELINK